MKNYQPNCVKTSMPTTASAAIITKAIKITTSLVSFFMLATLASLVGPVKPAWAASPVVAAVAYSEETVDTTTHDVTVPANNSGNLLIWFSGVDGIPTISDVPVGWNTLINTSACGSNLCEFAAWYKVSGGSESSFTYTTSSAETSANQVWTITGGHVASVPEQVLSSGNNAVPNPPSVTASWGAEDNLWIVGYVRDRDGGTVTAYPTNYDDNQYTDATGAGDSIANVSVGFATRGLNTDTENPGGFTTDGLTRVWLAFTIVVRPAAVVTRRPVPPVIF